MPMNHWLRFASAAVQTRRDKQVAYPSPVGTPRESPDRSPGDYRAMHTVVPRLPTFSLTKSLYRSTTLRVMLV